MSLRLSQAQEQASSLERAIDQARAEYAGVDPAALAVYLSSLVDELKAIRARIDEELGVREVETKRVSARLRLRGRRIGLGTAPATAVATIVDAVQTAVRQIAAYRRTQEAARRRVRREIENEVGLQVAFADGSLEILLQPERPQYDLEGGEPLADMALRAFFDVAAWAEDGERDTALEQLVSDPVVRRQVLNRVRAIAPRADGPYESLDISGLSVRANDALRRFVLTPRAYEHASNFLQRRERERVEIEGLLVVIDVERDMFRLRHGDRRIPCMVPEALRDRAIELIGHPVRVYGEGEFIGEEEFPNRIDVADLEAL